MNLIDFYVKEIIGETYDKVYKLYKMSNEQLENEKNKEDNEWWYEFLCGNGVKQVFISEDMGGKETKTEVFNLDKGQKPYYVGYKGLH